MRGGIYRREQAISRLNKSSIKRYTNNSGAFWIIEISRLIIPGF